MMRGHHVEVIADETIPDEAAAEAQCHRMPGELLRLQTIPDEVTGEAAITTRKEYKCRLQCDGTRI